MRSAKIISKLLTICAALCLCLLLTPNASAETISGTCRETLNWSYDTETCELTISGTGEVPQVNYDEAWYAYRNSIQSVVIENGVAAIANSAFYYAYTALHTVDIAESVHAVGSNAFSVSNSGLTAIVRGGMVAFDSWSFGYQPSNVTIKGLESSTAHNYAKAESLSFVSIGKLKTWINSSSLTKPEMDETMKTIRISTPQELAYIADRCNRQVSSYTGYTLQLTNDLDMSGLYWEPIRYFAGTLDGCGYMIKNLKILGMGLISLTDYSDYYPEASVCNLLMTDFEMCGEPMQSMLSPFGRFRNTVNCGAIGVVFGALDSVSNISWSGGNNVYYALQIGGTFFGRYWLYKDNVPEELVITEQQLQQSSFVDALNVPLSNAVDWKQGENGYPVMTPGKSRSWIRNIKPVSPKGNTYYVETEEELAYLGRLSQGGNSFSGMTIQLMADLDLSGKLWLPIGMQSYAQNFSGTFDGNNHTIYGLQVGSAEEDAYGGLFGNVNGEIRNVRIKNATLYVDGGGCLASTIDTIKNCSVENSQITGNSGETGALAGRVRVISNSYAQCDVTCTGVFGSAATGGLVGVVEESCTNCYSIGDVFGYDTTGGLIGMLAARYSANQKQVVVNNCYSTGNVSCVSKGPGMIIGSVTQSTVLDIQSSYWSTSDKAYQDDYQVSSVTVGTVTGYTTAAKSLSQMQKQSTYSGWDFTNVWAIDPNVNGGLPYLRSFGKVEIGLTGLTISDTACSLKTGEEFWLTVERKPVNATTAITWSSSNEAVAAVSSSGKVTAKSAGTAVVTAQGGRYSVSCTVTVTDRPVEGYVIDSLTTRQNGRVLDQIPESGDFFARVQITKKEDAGNAVVILASYTAAGKLLDLSFLEAEIPVGTTYALGSWIENAGGQVGKVKVFLLPSLSMPDPLCPLAEIEK